MRNGNTHDFHQVYMQASGYCHVDKKIEPIALASKIIMACILATSGNFPEAHCHKKTVVNRNIINNPAAPNRPKFL